jgi:hypothetical protein
MPHIIVFCFPAMKFEAGPGLRAHPFSARRSRRSHESLGHNRSPRGRFGKMNMSGKTHLNALHRCVAILKHAAASPVASAQSGQPLQSVRLIRSHRMHSFPALKGRATIKCRSAANRNCPFRVARFNSRRGFHPPRKRSTPGIVIPDPTEKYSNQGRCQILSQKLSWTFPA